MKIISIDYKHRDKYNNKIYAWNERITKDQIKGGGRTKTRIYASLPESEIPKLKKALNLLNPYVKELTMSMEQDSFKEISYSKGKWEEVVNEEDTHNAFTVSYILPLGNYLKREARELWTNAWDAPEQRTII